MAKAKKSKSRKVKAKKTAKKTKKSVKRAAAKAKPAKKSKKAVKAKARKPAKKAPAKKTKQVVGEGNYAATRAFDRDQTAFVKKNKAKIPALGKAAEAALEGPEGTALREAEATAADRSRDNF